MADIYTIIESTADETWLSDTTLKQIPGLEIDVSIGDVIDAYLVLIFDSSVTADIKESVSGGGTLTGSHGNVGLDNTTIGLPSSAIRPARIAGEKNKTYSPYIIENTVSAGTIVFNAAQAASDATTTTVFQGSLLYWRKLP